MLLEVEPSAEKYDELAKLAHDFVFAAETYGKIIISELSLPGESKGSDECDFPPTFDADRSPVIKKTIKPMAVGGQAGGEKYIVQGIFFKFALDIYAIYGGDQYAMYGLSLCPFAIVPHSRIATHERRKAASHDLKGLINYYSCQIPGLHVPLMARTSP